MLPFAIITSPSGSAGSISHESIAGPLFVTAMKALSFEARAYSVCAQEIRSGARLVMRILNDVEAEPPVLLAQIVKLDQST